MPLPFEVRPGEPASAAVVNAILAELRRLNQLATSAPLTSTNGPGGITIGIAPQPRFYLAELDEEIAEGEKDKVASLLAFDDSSPDLFADNDLNLDATCDPQKGLYLTGERHLFYTFPGSNQAIPLPGVQFHLGVADETIASGGSGTISVHTSSGDSTKNLECEDWLETGAEEGDKVYIWQHLQSKQWYFIKAAVSTTSSYCGLRHSSSVQYPTSFGGGGSLNDLLKVPFSHDLPNYNSTSDPANDRLTVETAGAYLLQFSATCYRHYDGTPNSNQGQVQFKHLKNGADATHLGFLDTPPTDSTFRDIYESVRFSSQTIVDSEVDDYWEIHAQSNQPFVTEYPFFTMHYIGPSS